MEKMQQDYRFSAYIEKEGIKLYLTFHGDGGVYAFIDDFTIRGIFPLTDFPYIVKYFGLIGLKFNREI